MAIDRSRTAGGALAGAVAALAWAAQQPLDKRVFEVDYDDCDLIGTAITSGPAARPIGWLVHTINGAAFGAAYANLAPRMPLPPWARGPAAAVTENTVLWPLTAVLHRVHPRADGVPQLWGSSRAFAQATWRHVVFGAILGSLEARFNAVAPGAEPIEEPVVSSNGHGDFLRAVVEVAPE